MTFPVKQKRVRRWLVRVVAGPDLGREFIVYGDRDLVWLSVAWVLRTTKRLRPSEHFQVSKAGYWNPSRCDIEDGGP